MTPSHRPADEHWSVTVSRHGEKIVTIETNCLTGRELSLDDEETIRTCARHLLAFIGDPAPLDRLADGEAG